MHMGYAAEALYSMQGFSMQEVSYACYNMEDGDGNTAEYDEFRMEI